MKIQRLAIVFTVAFAITLALVVGQRLSTEAMAVIVGVIAGVAASIPTSLIVVWVARNALASPGRDAPMPERKTEPADRDVKIIVMPAQTATAPASNPFMPPGTLLSPYPLTSQPRQFTIIGGEATSEEDLLPWR